MLVFFDESGDTGFKIGTGSSELFTVTMVVFEDHDEAQAADDRIALLRRELGKGPNYEFHFAQTPDPIRRAFFEAVTPYNFFFFSFVIVKRELDAKDWPSAEAFYRWVCGLIFESAKPSLDNAIVRLDESGGRGFRAQVGTDLKRQMNRESSRSLIKRSFFRFGRQQPFATGGHGLRSRRTRPTRQPENRFLSPHSPSPNLGASLARSRQIKRRDFHPVFRPAPMLQEATHTIKMTVRVADQFQRNYTLGAPTRSS